MRAGAVVENLADLESLQQSAIARMKCADATISTCCGTGCVAKGALDVFEALRAAVADYSNNGGIRVIDKCTGCHGFCEQGPIVTIQPQNILYTNVKQGDAAEIIERTAHNGEVIDRLLYRNPVTRRRVSSAKDIPFYSKQKRIVLSHNGILDPTDILDYIAAGGYRALWRALTQMSSDEVIAVVEKSGLRGRGGAGFPTGRKWASCRKAQGAVKYVICNGDEGDPGAFMDRSILEGDPHSVLEGMMIGAYAIGASEGFVYVRNEYPLAVARLQTAIAQAEKHGLLGADIFGTGFTFEIRINRGGGAFVCGESTALTASLEGRPGEPRMKYVRTVENGLWGMPTTINNVETWANIPRIIGRGADWYASVGTESSKGTKVFSLVGDVNNTGLVEVPMGMSLRELIFDIGGGIKKKRKFKAVQTGGPSGGCIPEAHLDCPVDFEELTKLGSMMGSGGMIVMDQDTCMVEVARYFTKFLAEESCGKCVPCREGLAQMLHVLTRITHGHGEPQDLAQLEFLCELLGCASLCGLGTSACNPVQTTLRYFRDEYVTHIDRKKCPAGVCIDLFLYDIDPEKCKGCESCKKACPSEAISGEKKQVHVIAQELCTKCGSCYEVCKLDAVRKV